MKLSPTVELMAQIRATRIKDPGSYSREARLRLKTLIQHFWYVTEEIAKREADGETAQLRRFDALATAFALRVLLRPELADVVEEGRGVTNEDCTMVRHMYVHRNMREDAIAKALGLPLDDVAHFIAYGTAMKRQRGEKAEVLEGEASSSRARATIFDLPHGDPLDDVINEMTGRN